MVRKVHVAVAQLGPIARSKVAPTRCRPPHRNVERCEVARRRLRRVPRSRADDVLPALVHDGRRGGRQLLRDRDAKRRHQAAVRNRNRARRRILPRLRGDLVRGQREASLQYLDPGRSGRKDRRQIPQGARARTSGPRATTAVPASRKALLRDRQSGVPCLSGR